jgi:hypothetical protein
MSKIHNNSSETREIPNFSITHVQKLEQGKQGITGLVRIENKLYVYKISQYMNYLTDHEYLILKGLNELEACCPHFCKILQKEKYPIHPNFRDKEQNPFEYNEKPIYIDVLFMEYIPDSIPLYNLIKETTIPMSHIMGVVKQIMMAVIIAQRKRKFVHYDLHSLNILMKDCRLDDVFLYVLDDQNVFCIPTYGYIPTIIDYGFSYSKDLEHNPSYISLAYTDAGYMSPGYDYLADAKIFLVSLAEDFKECRLRYKYTTKFRNIIKNIFKAIDIDWKSGWDRTHDEIPIIDQLFEYIENSVEQHSYLFKNYPQMCMDILQSLIILPYNPKIEGTLRELRKAYKVMVYEFSKIEVEVNNPFYSLYIFRQMIDLIRYKRDDYLNTDTRQQTLQFFKNNLFDIVNKSAKFCSLKTVHFENLLCSLFAFGQQLEFQLYRLLSKSMKKKLNNYKKLDVQCIEHMYTLLDMNFKDSYKFNSRTVLHVLNSQTNTREIIDFSDADEQVINQINQLPQFSRGHFLYSLYKDLIGEDDDEEDDEG